MVLLSLLFGIRVVSLDGNTAARALTTVGLALAGQLQRSTDPSEGPNDSGFQKSTQPSCHPARNPDRIRR